MACSFTPVNGPVSTIPGVRAAGRLRGVRRTAAMRWPRTENSSAVVSWDAAVVVMVWSLSADGACTVPAGWKRQLSCGGGGRAGGTHRRGDGFDAELHEELQPVVGHQRPHPGEHLAAPLVSAEAETVPDRIDERVDVGTLGGDAVAVGRGAVTGVEDGVRGSVSAEPFEAGQPRPVMAVGQVGVQ